MLTPKKIKSIIIRTKTPVYLYDRDCIKDSYCSLKKNLPSNIEIFYAVKANPHKDITAFLVRLGAGVDVASVGELRIALKSGVRPDKISFAGPGKTKDELKYAISKNVAFISVESEVEALIVNELSGRIKRVINVAIRVNPALGSQQAGLRMGGGSQQFGIDEEIVPQAIRTIKECSHLNLIGIHMHTGSQILSEEVIVQNVMFLLRYSLELQNKFGIKIKFINFGGGLGIPYYKGQNSLNVRKLGKLIKEAFDKIGTRAHFKNTRFVIEPGRFLVGESGVYVTKVLYKKQSRGKTFLIVDGGMHQNLAAAGLLGEGLRRNRIFGALTRKNTKKKEIVTIAGCLCTPLDILARDIELPKCEPGDYLYITCSGAYGYSASPKMFLSHPSPKEVIA